MGRPIKQLCNTVIEVYADGLQCPYLWLLTSEESCDNCVFTSDLKSVSGRDINKAIIDNLRDTAEQEAYDQGYLCCGVEVNIV